MKCRENFVWDHRSEMFAPRDDYSTWHKLLQIIFKINLDTLCRRHQSMRNSVNKLQDYLNSTNLITRESSSDSKASKIWKNKTKGRTINRFTDYQDKCTPHLKVYLHIKSYTWKTVTTAVTTQRTCITQIKRGIRQVQEYITIVHARSREAGPVFK